MEQAKVRAWAELSVTTLLLAVAPTKVVQGPDLPGEPDIDSLPDSVSVVGAADAPVEPRQRAINGFIRVSSLGGRPVEYYVGHDPAFIASSLLAAKEQGKAIYSYCDKPGHPDARQIHIATALVNEVGVRLLEADIDSLYEDRDSWAL